MGNKKSTHASSSEQQQQGQGNKDQVQKRAKKKGQKKQPRPMSDPGPIPDNTVEIYPNFRLAAAGSSPISGKHVTSSNDQPHVPSNQLSQLPAADYEEIPHHRQKYYEGDSASPAPDPYVVTGQEGGGADGGGGGGRPPSQLHQSPSTQARNLTVYKKHLARLLDVWPEFETLRDIDVYTLKPSAIETIQEVYKRVCDQHEHLQSVTADKDEAKVQLDELQEEVEALRVRMRRTEAMNTSQQQEITILRRELQKRGAAESPGRPHDLQEVGAGSESGRDSESGSKSDHMYPAERNNDQEIDQTLERFKHKQSIYKPTPLLSAEGIEGSRAAVKRTPSSIKPVGRSEPIRQTPPSGGELPSRSALSLGGKDEPVEVKLRRLEEALERERHEKNQLRYRMPPEDMRSGMTSAVTQQKVTKRYQLLEEKALGGIMHVINSHLGHVKPHRKMAFLAAVMQDAFNEAVNCLSTVKDYIHRLLIYPVQPVGSSQGQDSVNSSIMSDKAKKLDFPLDKGMSKLALRTLTGGEVPDHIMTHVLWFLESTSEVNDITTMLERVVDELSREFPECTTPALLNRSSFSQFLHDCCRLSWQMVLLVPPLHVTSDTSGTFDERCHVLHLPPPNQMATRVDHYVWPVLWSKRHGDVLCKGRVVVRT